MASQLTNRYEDFNSMSADELKLAVSVLAKTANQRLRALEKANLTKASNAYRYAETQAYDERRFMDTTKHGEIKFKTTTRGRSLQELKEEVAQLQGFLFNAKTSTVRGTKQRYEQAYETWKDVNPDKKMSFEDFGEMWLQSNMKKLVRMYGSDVAIEIMGGEHSKGLTMEEINDIVGELDEEESFLSMLEKFDKKSNNKKLSTANLDTSVL